VREFLLLVVGFVLTSVLGGFLGSYLQNRAWRNQHTVALREADRAAAMATCTELSRLLDTRLYRMRKLYWSLQQSGDGTIDDANIRGQRSSYQEVLYQWNDALNSNLAMTETYFGSAVREFLENTIYEQFAGLGRQLDRAVRQQLSGEGRDDVKTLSDSSFQSLSHHIYRFNLEMLSLIQAGAVGRARTDGSMRAFASQGTLRRGDTGSSVRRWQRDLHAQGLDVAEDGAFGSATEQATKAFQKRSGLPPDGIVGDETRGEMARWTRGKQRND
jgi:murein L,D-transpeptidase YcbB/YkuD